MEEYLPLIRSSEVASDEYTQGWINFHFRQFRGREEWPKIHVTGKNWWLPELFLNKYLPQSFRNYRIFLPVSHFNSIIFKAYPQKAVVKHFTLHIQGKNFFIWVIGKEKLLIFGRIFAPVKILFQALTINMAYLCK